MTEYEIRVNRPDMERAIRKLIKRFTGYCMEEDKYMLEHTFFYNIKLESMRFDCIEGEVEYIYTFSDDGSLKEWGDGFDGEDDEWN